MKFTRKQLTVAIVGTAAIIPCCIVGKFIGVALGTFVGSLSAYVVVEKTYDFVAEKFGHKDEAQPTE